MDRFAIIANPRTGSTALANFFRDIDVYMFYEPFRDDKWAEGVRKHMFEVEEVLESAYYRTGHLGMKHIITHLDVVGNHKLSIWLKNNNIRTILLRRNNVAFGIISQIVASRTGVWELQHGDTGTETLQYNEVELNYIDPAWIQMQVQEQLELDKEFDLYDFPVVYYEDLFNIPQEQMHKEVDYIFTSLLKVAEYDLIRDFILVMANTHFSPGLKQNKPHIFERIPNWEELRKEFNLD